VVAGVGKRGRLTAAKKSREREVPINFLKVGFDLEGVHKYAPGLPDFSWFNIPKWGKYTK
jgi:hypothetical protein